ncbi:aminotransferase class IV [Thermovibrio sp.]
MELGLIETVRVERGRVILLPLHYKRFKESSKLLGLKLKLSQKEFEERALKEALKKEEPTLVRFLLTEKGLSVSSRKCLKRKEIKLLADFSFKRSYSLISHIKTTSKAQESSFFLKRAKEAGFEEGITFSQEGFLSECCYSNIFFLKGRTLFTPSLKCGCLRGTRREFVLKLCSEMGIEVVEGFFGLRELLEAEEVFITSAREDCCRVVQVGNRKLKKVEGKPFSERIREVIEWMEFKGQKAPES